MTDGNLLQQGSDWLEQMRTTHCSSLVEYFKPPSTDVLIVNATFGKTDYEIVDESGLTVGSHVWDFLILADELGFEPAPGDAIVANGRRYEVMAWGDDFRGWRFSDPFRKTFRIHTRDMGEAT